MTGVVDQAVLSNVDQYLKGYGSSWEAHSTGARFFWNKDLPLHEVAIRSADGREGYMLVSESPELPFLISKGLRGQLLSEILTHRLAQMAEQGAIETGIQAESFQYIVPFGFIAHMTDGTAIQLDDGVVVGHLKGSVDQAPPSGETVQADIAAEWALLQEGLHNAEILTETILDPGPYYNQAFNSSCVISGCTAVAWATWAAWLKGNAALLPTLFASTDCWYDDWSSYWRCRQPTEECQEVDKLIWWFNQTLGTVNGSTPANNVGRGTAVFKKYGNANVHARAVAADAATIGGLVRRGHAVLFCGVREWQYAMMSPNKLGTKNDAPAGHCIVVHGIRGNEIYVNMGWGEYTQSLWWNVNSISQRQAFGLFTS